MAEEIYQESLEIELELRGLPFLTKPELVTRYKGKKLKKKYLPDLMACEEVVVELKSVKELTSDHEAQLFNYMRIARQPVGYLINFGAGPSLEWQRLVLDDLKPRRTGPEQDSPEP